ncbi:methionyl-tRNA formyltransferase [Bacteroidales bacterium OttesenSCG-928-I14]|nr:methionyl-tRNA formyltransferase [Bacteroidales bacterium OttesenSCG-928-I14]
MDKKDLKIVYLGTPDFAVEPLRALIDGGYNLIAAVTMPDKPKGKHHSVLQPSPVKEYALSQNIPVLQPENLKDPAFIEQLRTLNADIQIVVAFRMLPEIVWNMPRLGTFNLHASLLPQYRGAAPINWAIINGEKETGITTFFLTHEIDTGKVIDQVKVPIAETDNVEIVHDKLMCLGAELVVKTVDDILNDRVNPIAQEDMASFDSENLKPAPKIFKETCKINWNMTTDEIYNFVRGLSPYPAAWTELTAPNGNILNLKIYEVEKVNQASDLQPATVVSDGKRHLDVKTKDGFIRLRNIQLTGKKRMDTAAFLAGNKIL